MDIAKPAPTIQTGTVDARRCGVCTRPRTLVDVRGLGWSSEHAPDGTIRWICGPCTRTHLFEIEAGRSLASVQLRASA